RTVLALIRRSEPGDYPSPASRARTRFGTLSPLAWGEGFNYLSRYAGEVGEGEAEPGEGCERVKVFHRTRSRYVCSGDQQSSTDRPGSMENPLSSCCRFPMRNSVPSAASA